MRVLFYISSEEGGFVVDWVLPFLPKKKEVIFGHVLESLWSNRLPIGLVYDEELEAFTDFIRDEYWTVTDVFWFLAPDDVIYPKICLD